GRPRRHQALQQPAAQVRRLRVHRRHLLDGGADAAAHRSLFPEISVEASMKSAVGPFAAAVVLALAGAAFWVAGQTENRLADVHKQLAMLRYADAASEGGAFEDSLGLERRVPLIGRAVETDARDVRAAAGYWRSDYGAVAPQKDA